MVGLGTLEFSGEKLEPPGFAFCVQLLVRPFGKPVQLLAGHTIFVFGVVLGINFDGAKSNHLAVNRHADILPFQAALEPRAQILPGSGDGKCFHKDILMSLLRLSSVAQRGPARVARSRADQINCAFGFHAPNLAERGRWAMKEEREQPIF
jgi:hypothetical protein